MGFNDRLQWIQESHLQFPPILLSLGGYKNSLHEPKYYTSEIMAS